MDDFRAIRRVLWITMGLNLLATAGKLVVGYATGSLSLIADGFDSVFDAASNVIGLVGIWVASRPADEGHPYGHRKAETLTALIIAMLLFITTWELISSAVERLRDPSLITAEVTILSFGALILSIVIHSTVVWYEMRAGRRLRSDVLVADAMHTRADILVSVAVGVGLLFVWLGYPLADPILALVVALFIAKIGIDILRESVPTLMDERTLPVAQAEEIILGVPGVLSSHHVRSRGHEMAMYADLHIQVDPAMSTEQSHAIAHEVQRRLRAQEPNMQDVTIHVEPARLLGSEPSREGIAVQLRRLADGLGLAVHDVWANEVEGTYQVEIHLEAQGSLPLQEAHRLASALEERAHAEIPGLAELTTHIEPQGKTIRASQVIAPKEEILQAVNRVLDQSEHRQFYHHIQAFPNSAGWSISLHCRLPGQTSLDEAHRYSTALESKLLAEVPGLVRAIIHTEPVEDYPGPAGV